MAEEEQMNVIEGGTRGKTSAVSAAAQVSKLRDANLKYKNLLKLAKERIQQQENELELQREEVKRLTNKISEKESEAPNHMTIDETNDGFGGGSSDAATETSISVVRVCQRVRVDDGNNNGATTDDDDGEIWALLEFDAAAAIAQDEPQQQHGMNSHSSTRQLYKKWKRFETESDLADFIRRDTGEPLTLPPYSLSPEQSARIQEETKQAVFQITEEFRRFRVRSELSKKQLEAQIRDLQATNVESAQRRIEGQDLEKELERARSEHFQLERLRAEMAEQESRWKEAYDLILSENNALKSSGSEALLAAQWRQRYEASLAEKEDLATRLQLEMEKTETAADQRRKADAGKYEMKYRDIKESFRLYRKKAKEIFEAQQRGDVGLLSIADGGGDDAKLSYLKNLMVSYLSADAAVREHMEGAIGTILKFTPDDVAKIEQKRAENDRWF